MLTNTNKVVLSQRIQMEEPMFERLRGLAERVASRVLNPWRYGSGDYYIALYENEFGILARALSTPSRKVWERVTLDPLRVEFRSNSGTIASLQMHGECGSVYETLVSGKLSMVHRLIFTALMPGKLRFDDPSPA